MAVRASTIWLTGLPAAGKSTLAAAVAERLAAEAVPVQILDGDVLRAGLSADLGFDRAGRAEQCRRAAHLALMLAEAGTVAVVALVSPYGDDRDAARAVHARAGVPFFEVFLDTPPEVCARRDPKGLYARARRGEITGFTGVDDPYERPAAPALVVRGHGRPPAEAAARVVALLSG